MKKAVCILSGGLDSTVTYFWMKERYEEVKAINFRYGSKHNTAERMRAREIAQPIEIDIDLSFLDSLLMQKSSENISEEDDEKKTVVPFRNAILLSYAVAFADNFGYGCVAYGAHWNDHRTYPDCRTEFFLPFSQAAQAGTTNGVEIIAPFIQKTKAEIILEGVRMGILDELYKSWSCYNGDQGDGLHCGVCPACRTRKRAFLEAGIEDRTGYRI